MVYVSYVIREMFQKTYVIRDLNENRHVIRDLAPPFTTPFIRQPGRVVWAQVLKTGGPGVKSRSLQ